jgi:hypothetical protein
MEMHTHLRSLFTLICLLLLIRSIRGNEPEPLNNPINDQRACYIDIITILKFVPKIRLDFQAKDFNALIKDVEMLVPLISQTYKDCRKDHIETALKKFMENEMNSLQEPAPMKEMNQIVPVEEKKVMLENLEELKGVNCSEACRKAIKCLCRSVRRLLLDVIHGNCSAIKHDLKVICCKLNYTIHTCWKCRHPREELPAAPQPEVVEQVKEIAVEMKEEKAMKCMEKMKLIHEEMNKMMEVSDARNSKKVFMKLRALQIIPMVNEAMEYCN